MQNKTPLTIVFCLILLALICQGCSQSYTTPGRGASLAKMTFDETDAETDVMKQAIAADGNVYPTANSSISDIYRTQPAANFPARLAVVRVQESGYHSYSCHSHGYGNFSVVLTRDIEGDEDFLRIAAMDNVAGLCPLNSLVIPKHLTTIKDLRIPAAQMHTDILLIYTIDTTFNVVGKDIGPLSLISLGFLPNQKAFVSTTASAAFIDVRTGYIYGLAEATDRQSKIASTWSSSDAVDATRIKTERQAFVNLIAELEKNWTSITSQYSNTYSTKL